MVYPYLVHYPKDCSDLKYKRSKSGVYRIYPDNVKSFKVYCDMETDGGSWTVIIIQSFLLFVYICINVGNPIIKMCSDPIIRFNQVIFMCLSKAYTWIYIGIGHSVFMLTDLRWDVVVCVVYAFVLLTCLLCLERLIVCLSLLWQLSKRNIVNDF